METYIVELHVSFGLMPRLDSVGFAMLAKFSAELPRQKLESFTLN